MDYKILAYIEKEILPDLGVLSRERNVELYWFDRSFEFASAVELYNLIQAQLSTNVHMASFSFENLKSCLNVLLSSQAYFLRLDLGYLITESKGDVVAALQAHLDTCQFKASSDLTRDVVLFGFGRIGRILARLLTPSFARIQGLKLRAIVVRGKADVANLKKRLSLLLNDSVHGRFNANISIDETEHGLLINGTLVRIIYAAQPDEVDYQSYGYSNVLVVDNTGVFKTDETLSRHLQSKGVSQVLLTAPAKGDVPNVVYGVNTNDIDGRNVVSAASCTTNAIAPVLKVISDSFGIERGHIETIHSYTNDQNLVDNQHKSDRRGRAAALNMVITSTGATSAVEKALPALKGKLSGNAVRVPTPNVSLAILNLNLESDIDLETLNQTLNSSARSSTLRYQIQCVDSNEFVSTDALGSPFASVVDLNATLLNGRSLILYVWYDNEYGYSSQVVRVMERMSQFNYQTI